MEIFVEGFFGDGEAEKLYRFIGLVAGEAFVDGGFEGGQIEVFHAESLVHNPDFIESREEITFVEGDGLFEVSEFVFGWNCGAGGFDEGFHLCDVGGDGVAVEADEGLFDAEDGTGGDCGGFEDFSEGVEGLA